MKRKLEVFAAVAYLLTLFDANTNNVSVLVVELDKCGKYQLRFSKT